MAGEDQHPSEEPARKRILIADDNAYYLTIISEALSEAGYDIETLSDGFATQEKIQSEKKRLDLVILNRDLPGLSGMDVIRKVRETTSKKELVILVMDVFTKKGEEVEELKNTGASGYFNKSIPIEEIVYRINDLLFPPERFSRKNPRAVIYLPVEYRIGESTTKSYSFTLSADGMYIQSMSPPPPRTNLELHFKLGEGLAVQTSARVLYRYKYDPHRNRSVLPGMAVQFTGLGEERRATINKFVVETLVQSVRTQKEALGSEAHVTTTEQIVTCDECTGLGKVAYVTCNSCAGTGKDCGICRGTGQNPFIRKVCPRCHGVGSVKLKTPIG